MKIEVEIHDDHIQEYKRRKSLAVASADILNHCMVQKIELPEQVETFLYDFNEQMRGQLKNYTYLFGNRVLDCLEADQEED